MNAVSLVLSHLAASFPKDHARHAEVEASRGTLPRRFLQRPIGSSPFLRQASLECRPGTAIQAAAPETQRSYTDDRRQAKKSQQKQLPRMVARRHILVCWPCSRGDAAKCQVFCPVQLHWFPVGSGPASFKTQPFARMPWPQSCFNTRGIPEKAIGRSRLFFADATPSWEVPIQALQGTR